MEDQVVEYTTLLDWEGLASRSLYIRALTKEVGGYPDSLELPDYLPRELLDEVMAVLGDPADDDQVVKSLTELVIRQRDAQGYISLFTYLATDEILKKMLDVAVEQYPKESSYFLATVLNKFTKESQWASYIFGLLRQFTTLTETAIWDRITKKSDRSTVSVCALKGFIRGALRGAQYHKSTTGATCGRCAQTLRVKIAINQHRVHYETRMMCCGAIAHKHCFWEAVRERVCHSCGFRLQENGSFVTLRLPMSRVLELGNLWTQNGVDHSHILLPPGMMVPPAPHVPAQN